MICDRLFDSQRRVHQRLSASFALRRCLPDHKVVTSADSDVLSTCCEDHWKHDNVERVTQAMWSGNVPRICLRIRRSKV